VSIYYLSPSPSSPVVSCLTCAPLPPPRGPISSTTAAAAISIYNNNE
jgi:hypothetical protein